MAVDAPQGPKRSALRRRHRRQDATQIVVGRGVAVIRAIAGAADAR